MNEIVQVLTRGTPVARHHEIWHLHRISRSEAIFRHSSSNVELRMGKTQLAEEFSNNTLQVIDSPREGDVGLPWSGRRLVADEAFVLRIWRATPSHTSAFYSALHAAKDMRAPRRDAPRSLSEARRRARRRLAEPLSVPSFRQFIDRAIRLS